MLYTRYLGCTGQSQKVSHASGFLEPTSFYLSLIFVLTAWI